VQIASLGDTLWGDYPGSAGGGYVGGTSAAAATVSGVAALLFSAYPGASAAQVRRAIIVGANRDVPGLRGTNEANGLLSASGALAAMAQPDPSNARTERAPDSTPATRR
jgi:subtilisin family serine protease